MSHEHVLDVVALVPNMISVGPSVHQCRQISVRDTKHSGFLETCPSDFGYRFCLADSVADARAKNTFHFTGSLCLKYGRSLYGPSRQDVNGENGKMNRLRSFTRPAGTSALQRTAEMPAPGPSSRHIPLLSLLFFCPALRNLIVRQV